MQIDEQIKSKEQSPMDLLDFSCEKGDDNCVLREIEIELVDYNKVEKLNKSNNYQYNIQKKLTEEYKNNSTKPKLASHLLPENINTNYQVQENFNSHDNEKNLDKDQDNKVNNYDLIINKNAKYIVEESKRELETNRKTNRKSEDKKEVRNSSSKKEPSSRYRPEQKREVDQNTEGKESEDFVITAKSHSRISSCDQSSILCNPITQRPMPDAGGNNLFGDEKSGAEEFEALFGSNLVSSRLLPVSDYSQSEYSQRSGYRTNMKPQTGYMQKTSSVASGRTRGKGRNPFNDMESKYAQPVEQ
jgi:hypothetical protein